MTDSLDRLNEYLDGDSERPAPDLGDVDARELASQLLAEAAARQFLRDGDRPVRELVQAGMAAIDDETRRQRGARILRFLGPLAAAAAVLVTATLIWWSMQPTALETALQEMRQFITAEADRQYSVRADVHRGSWPGPPPFIRNVRPLLTVRGQDRFVMSVEAEFGLGSRKLAVHQGFDGEEYWLAPPDIFGLPVFRSQTSLANCYGAGEIQPIAERFLPGLERMESQGHFFRILARLEENYDLTENATKPTTATQPTTIIGTRRSTAPVGLPDGIECTVGPGGAVEQVVIHYDNLPDIRGRENPFRRIRFRLVGSTQRGSGFYRLRFHHDGRRVLSMD